MQDPIKTIFFGTPEFAAIVLDKLIQAPNIEIVGVVTTPDKPVGRKHILTPSPVKILAEKNQLPILQPEKLNSDFITQLENLKADLFVTAAYGKIIPQTVLDIPQHKCINVHPSLLPQYRGASPIQSAILNGESKTGTTIMLMDKKMDHGPILATEVLSLKTSDTFLDVHDKLANLSADLLIKSITDFVAGKLKPTAQNHSQATFCKMIEKKDGEINWQQSANQIYNQWRAFQVWPGIYKEMVISPSQKIIIKFTHIMLSDPTLFNKDTKPGEFIVKDKQLFVSCGNKSWLEIKKLQPQGKKEMDAISFINGYLK